MRDHRRHHLPEPFIFALVHARQDALNRVFFGEILYGQAFLLLFRETAEKMFVRARAVPDLDQCRISAAVLGCIVICAVHHAG
jgi:hypothetical protein